MRTILLAGALALMTTGGAAAETTQNGADASTGLHVETLRQYVSASSQGNLEARFRAAEMFEAGLGTDPNPEKAAKWYQMAAREGHVGAMKRLAAMFAEGRGVDADLVQAWAIYNVAASRGANGAANRRDAIAAQLRAGELQAGERRSAKIAKKFD